MVYRFIKRAFDICASLLAILISSPVWLIIAIGIKLSSKGPVFYRADRIGKHLQVRLSHGDQNAKHKADQKQQPQLLLPGKACAHMGAHWGHCQVSAHVKHTNTKNQQHSADGEGDQLHS